jgi:hypothetical protein
LTTIDDQLDRDFAPAWRPKPGDQIVGVVTDLAVRDGDYGRYPVVTIRAEGSGFDGEVAIHAFHAVLASELARVEPKVGDQIGIRYLGLVDGAERSYHGYRVAKEGLTDPVVDWSAFRDIGAEEAPVGKSLADRAAPELGPPADRGGLADDEPLPF